MLPASWKFAKHKRKLAGTRMLLLTLHVFISTNKIDFILWRVHDNRKALYISVKLIAYEILHNFLTIAATRGNFQRMIGPCSIIVEVAPFGKYTKSKSRMNFDSGHKDWLLKTVKII